MLKKRSPEMKWVFMAFSSVLLVFFVSQAVSAENSTITDDSRISLINELYGENITNGEFLSMTDPDTLGALKKSMTDEEFRDFCSRQKYWGDDYPELSHGANFWDENGPVNLSSLNRSEKEIYGLESTLIGKDGYVILGYMKNSVEEGESVPFYKTMPEGIENFTCDLNWMDSGSELKITIFSPDGMMGPYSDDSDGVVNGRIFLRISRPEGIESGEWYAVVQADKTDKKQHFVLLFY
ncbi:hypothetical protein J2128_002166 [Methanomicrobium sp. W14]|uniref:hypothetical protein n=1 Tax=Methanomicrobium sp. W14 TaxID=2817839 RepID=UPI001AE409CE|nr:hypothetical protein [Methanomicrobium sp. W14]MBP2134200.1 hypothetical protein [Methanomicrobium sp. W14]